MRKITTFLVLTFFSLQIVAQHKKIEDSHGHLITDSIQKKQFYQKRDQEKLLNSSHTVAKRASLSAVHLCSNSNFEEYENQSGTNVLKTYLYTTADPYNPTQCVTPAVTADQYIPQYDPTAPILMA